MKIKLIALLCSFLAIAGCTPAVDDVSTEISTVTRREFDPENKNNYNDEKMTKKADEKTSKTLNDIYWKVRKDSSKKEDANNYDGQQFIGYYICHLKSDNTQQLFINKDSSLPTYYSWGSKDKQLENFYFFVVSDKETRSQIDKVIKVLDDMYK